VGNSLEGEFFKFAGKLPHSGGAGPLRFLHQVFFFLRRGSGENGCCEGVVNKVE
jgi:hypothetical protein